MDSQTEHEVVLIGASIIGFCIIVALLFKRRVRAKVDTPHGSFELGASDDQQLGVQADDLRSRRGSVSVIDGTGRGASARGVDASGDVVVTSQAKGESKNPKA